MKTLKIIALSTLMLLGFNCKEEPKQFADYQFIDKGETVSCENMDTKLFNEALYSFEEDIKNFYGNPERDRGNLLRPYSSFVREAVTERANYAEIVSPHTIKVFEALKTKKEIWNEKNLKSNLNYRSAFFQCMANHIKDDALTQTMKALLDTDSMSPKLFGAPLQTSSSQALNDKYLAAYIAFDLYYAKLFDVDLSQVAQKEKNEDASLTDEAPVSDPHAGHNH